MARTKKQTLENASERKRLIQEEILRESLAAKQKTASTGDASQSSASPTARSRAKGKHRPRHALSSPNGVASHASSSSAHTDTPVAAGVSSSTRRKKGGLRECSKSNDSARAERTNDQATPTLKSSEVKKAAAAAAEAPSNKGDMPKAVLCIPDIYSSPSSSSGGDLSLKNQGSEKTPQATTDVAEHGKTTTPKTSPSGSRKQNSGSPDQDKQNLKKGLQDSVEASLKSLKAASEMVREEKKRTSRQRSPGSSKEESPGSQSTSPERRSPRHHSPSNSSDSVQLQQQSSAGKKKKGKQKAHVDERPKVNIFTDNIGVELGKRVRSPRRLSEDMIALPIFSARRWSSSPREASYIAEKSDGDAVSAKSSPEDNESFKPPHAVHPNQSVTKGSGSIQSKKKGSSSSKAHSLSAPASDNGGEEEKTPVRKMRTPKMRGKLDLAMSTDNFNTSDEETSTTFQNTTLPKKPKKDKDISKTSQNKNQSKLESDAFCEVIQDKGSKRLSEKKTFCESRELLDKGKQSESSLSIEKKESNAQSFLNENMNIFESDSIQNDCDSGDKQISGCSNSASAEIGEATETCENTVGVNKVKIVKIEFTDLSDSNAEVIQTGFLQSQEQKTDLTHQGEDLPQEHPVRTDTPPGEPSEKTQVLKPEESRKPDDNAPKSPSKKSKGKSQGKATSGEKKKKPREKMKIGDEVLSSICRDIMSGVVITPGSGLENDSLSKVKKTWSKIPEENQTVVTENIDSPKSPYSCNISSTMSSSPGFSGQAVVSMGTPIQKDTGTSPNTSLLQPAKNILCATSPRIHVVPISSVITSTSTSTLTPSTSVSAMSPIPSPHTIASNSPQPVTSMPASLSLGSAKLSRPIFGHQGSNVKNTSQDLNIDKSPPGPNLTKTPNTSVVDAQQSVAVGQTGPSQDLNLPESVTENSKGKESVLDVSGSVTLVEENLCDKKIENKDSSSLKHESPNSSDILSIAEVKIIHDSVSSAETSKAYEYEPLDPVNSSHSVSEAGVVVKPSPVLPEPIFSPTVNCNQAKSVMDANCDLGKASPCSSAQVSCKDSPKSSLLCAMLVGGSEVAHTYEKSKPAVAGAPLSLETSIDSDSKGSHIVPSSSSSSSSSSRQCIQSPSAASIPDEKVSSSQHTSLAENMEEGNETSKAAVNTSGVKFDLLSEKGDAPLLDGQVVKTSTETICNSGSLNEGVKQLVNKEKVQRDLKIDIASKLRGLDETVLKLLDIDVEEAFLDTAHRDSKELTEIKEEPPFIETDENFTEGRMENVPSDADLEEKLKPDSEVQRDEKLIETPLYGVISNLAGRLKGKALTVDVEDLLNSCPKHMLKICTQVDEEARWDTLRLRLEEEIKENRNLTSETIVESQLDTKPVVSNVCSIDEKGSTVADAISCNSGSLIADKFEDSRVTEMSCGEKSGDMSPHMTNSSSTNNSLCDLDTEAMTSAVKDACMEVATENVECKLKELKEELVEKDPLEVLDPDLESSPKRLFHKSKTFDFAISVPNPSTLRRVNSSPQLVTETPCQSGMTSELLLEISKGKDLQAKSKLGSKIPVPGTSYTSKPVKKSWRTPRIIPLAKPLTVLSELEESSASEKNIFTCPNLQKYLNVPSNRVIVPPHKRKEMQVLDEKAQRDEEERAAKMAERSDKERAEELINLEYLQYEPDFDDVDGLLFMSFSCEAELTAHSRVEKALQWDKDDTMLRIAQAKAFEEAKQTKVGMEAVKFKHLRGQHMRWKKYRRLYSSEVKSILNGAPSSVEEHLKREAASKAGFKKTSDVSKIKNFKSKTGLARQQLEIRRQKAREWRLARKEKLLKAKLSNQMLSTTPAQLTPTFPPDLSAPRPVQHQDVPPLETDTSGADNQLTLQLHKPGPESGTDLDAVPALRSKRRAGFSHQKEHKQLFKELNMDWEDRMIHRKLGGWSLKGNRPKAFSQAAHKREEKQRMMMGEEWSNTSPSVANVSNVNAVDSSTDDSKTPSRVSSTADISSPVTPKDELDAQKKKKSMKLVYPLLSERMARNALKVLINFGGASSGRGKHAHDDVDGSRVDHPRSSRRKAQHKHLLDDLPALRPILPHPASSNVSPVVLIDAAAMVPASGCTGDSSKCETDKAQVSPAWSLLATATGSPALSDLSKSDYNMAATPSLSSLAANVNSSVPSSPTPPAYQPSSSANTPSVPIAGLADTKEDSTVLEGVDTLADAVSSPSVADSASTKSCGKPGCRYGCICHLCSEMAASSTSPVGKSQALTCDKEYCRLGCICDSLDPEKPIPEVSHCGKPSCMLDCICVSKSETNAQTDQGHNAHSAIERHNRKKAKAKRNRNKERSTGSDIDNIPYLPSMKRRPKQPGDRFSNLPQRQKTHRSAKNLDAITRKAMMLYETSEIYCEKTERPPRRDQKDVTLGLSGAAIDDDFSFIPSTADGPVIEIDSPPEEESMMVFERDKIGRPAAKKQRHEGKFAVGGTSAYPALGSPTYRDNYDIEEVEDDAELVLPLQEEDYLALRYPEEDFQLSYDGKRQMLPMVEQSAHKRKRKSHPLSSEIFTLSTCARTQPYNYKRKQNDQGSNQISVDTATTNLMRLAPRPSSHLESGTDALVPEQTVSGTSNSGAALSTSEVLPSALPAVSQQMMRDPQVSPLPVPKAPHPVPKSASRHSQNSRSSDGGEVSGRKRHHQTWHTSMVCLKARGPPPKRKTVASQPVVVEEEEEEDVQEEDEVKLLEFLANCNWDGARKEILGKVAQCLTRGQYPHPRTMNICEFLVEILPKAHKPSVIPEELRKKLPGKMYSIRVRVTRREILPRPPSDQDTQVIDLSESSPIKNHHASPTCADVPVCGTLQTNAQQQAMAHLPTNVGISGLSRMCVTGNTNPRSTSAPNSRRSSTEVTESVPQTDPSVNDCNFSPSLTQVKKKGASLQASFNRSSTESKSSLEVGKSMSLALSSESTTTSHTTLDPSTNLAVPSVLYSPSTGLQSHKSNKLKPLGNMNTMTRSLLTSSSITSSAGETIPTSGVMPFLCSVNSNDIKYMKIQGKDGLMKVVGVNKNNTLVTVPLSVGQKLSLGDPHQRGAAKTHAVPFITVPVCGPSGHKIVPLIPSPLPTQIRPVAASPVVTSGSLATSHQPILLRFPKSTQAYPHAFVKSPVVLHPVGAQQVSGKFQPLLIPSSSKSLLNIAPKLKVSSQPSDASSIQKQLAVVTSEGKAKKITGNDEMIIAFNSAHVKQLKVSKGSLSEASQKNVLRAESQDQPGLPLTTLVTPSVMGPIMSSEESRTILKDSEIPNQSSGLNASSCSGGKPEEGTEAKSSKKHLKQVGEHASDLQKGAEEKISKEISVSAEKPEGRHNTQKGPNVYVPKTKQESSTLIMVYPPSDMPTASLASSIAVPKSQPNETGAASVIDSLDNSKTKSIVSTGSAGIFTQSAPVSLSHALTTVSTHSTMSAPSLSSSQAQVSHGSSSQVDSTAISSHSILPLSSSSSKVNHPMAEANALPLTSQSPQLSLSLEGLIPSLSSNSVDQKTKSLGNALSHEPSKHAVKRKWHDETCEEESTSSSSNKKQLLGRPDAQGLPPNVDEQQESNSSFATATGIRLGLVSPSIAEAAGTTSERPISSMSTSLSTGSSDNLHIMLSSDESDVDVGEMDDPRTIIAHRENAERALEMDHGYQRMTSGYQRMISSGSTSPLSVEEKSIKVAIGKSKRNLEASEHNMRERIRRSRLKELFLDLQRNVCSATGAKFDPNLSRANTLKQAKSTILRLIEQDREGRQKLKREHQKKRALTVQKQMLTDKLSRILPPQTIQDITEQAVIDCRRQRAARLLAAAIHYQSQHLDDIRDKSNELASHSEKSICGRRHKKKSSGPQSIGLTRDQSADGLSVPPDVSQPNSSQSSTVAPEDGHSLSVRSSPSISIQDDCSQPSIALDSTPKVTANAPGKSAHIEPDEAVDLISSSSSGECDHASVEADRGSPSPARYEDISDPDEDAPVSQAQAVASPVVAAAASTTVGGSIAAPQTVQCYEDISDVEESKLAKYEDISDSEEAVVVP